jgi:hypothetical protein
MSATILEITFWLLNSSAAGITFFSSIKNHQTVNDKKHVMDETQTFLVGVQIPIRWQSAIALVPLQAS